MRAAQIDTKGRMFDMPALIDAISWRSGNESLAPKIAFGAFFSLGLLFIVFCPSNSMRCEVFMLVSNFARSFHLQTELIVIKADLISSFSLAQSATRKQKN